MAQFEHIKPILRRVFESLEREWKKQEEREEIEVEDQGHIITASQI